jgi:hypothetical protein
MSSVVAQSMVSRSEYECPVALPYRLDLMGWTVIE